MKKVSIKNYVLIALTMMSMQTHMLHADCYAHTILVPRQMATNPVYEDALIFDIYAHMDDDFLISVKPIYTQTVGSSLKKYFAINHACAMNVRENGSGNIDSL